MAIQINRYWVKEPKITQPKGSLNRKVAILKKILYKTLAWGVVAPLILVGAAYVFWYETKAQLVSAFDKEVLYSNTEKIVHVPVEFPPILKKICDAESGGKHFAKNGQVLINKTQDVGYCQINVTIWGKKATELGYDLYNEEDNKAMALWIFNNYGSEPWHLSKTLWKK